MSSNEAFPSGPDEIAPRHSGHEQASDPGMPLLNPGGEPLLYLAGINQPDKRVRRYPLYHRPTCWLNVANSAAGVARWQRWKGRIGEVALFQGCYPQDPKCPDLKLVGVYPVRIDGWARIKLQDVAGKGEHFTSPLYIVPGSALMKCLGLGLEHRLNVQSFLKGQIGKGKEYERDARMTGAPTKPSSVWPMALDNGLPPS